MEGYLTKFSNEMQKVLVHLDNRLRNIHTGIANIQPICALIVNYNGKSMRIDQIAKVQIQDTRQIIIRPNLKMFIQLIEKAILSANLGYNPRNEGEIIRIIVPSLTQEIRNAELKKIKTVTEDARMRIRTIQTEARKIEKESQKKGSMITIPASFEKDITKLCETSLKKIQELSLQKEKELTIR